MTIKTEKGRSEPNLNSSCFKFRLYFFYIYFVMIRIIMGRAYDETRENFGDVRVSMPLRLSSPW